MRTVSEIQAALFEDAPAYMKESWDNAGLLCGRGSHPVETALVALDPFPDVAREAKERGAQLLVTHHPLIFGSIQSVNDGSAVGRTILYLVENGIAAVNLHTNLDAAPGGVNDVLAAALGLADVRVLCPAGEDGEGRPYGLGRYGTVPPCPLPEFLRLVCSRLGCAGLRYVDGKRPVRTVAVGGGACGEFLRDAARLGCDTFVTADLKYNQFADAKELGVNLIDAGHFPTENLVCKTLAARLRERFPELRVLESERHHDCVAFYTGE